MDSRPSRGAARWHEDSEAEYARLAARGKAALASTPLREALERAGFEPPENVCGSCKHPGGQHDLGNWCLTCPRPETTFEARAALGRVEARRRLGWCYFSSMSRDERWAYGLAALGEEPHGQ